MSPTIISNAVAQYVPVSDSQHRQIYGIQKSRKQASTGGGRAWSEEEEVYLLQTRLQKMPYKHIANHLKKTELACRLHYHQLSHASNRRKRTASMSSASSFMSRDSHSPIMSVASRMPSPIHEAVSPSTASSYTYSPAATQIHLPSIDSQAMMRLPSIRDQIPCTSESSPRLLSSILSKPTVSRTALCDPPLRLDCNTQSLTQLYEPKVITGPVNMARLARIYESHRPAFWSSIAAEYGEGVNAMLLEQVWGQGHAMTPPTPCGSPNGSVDAPCHDKVYTEHDTQERIRPGKEVKETMGVKALLGIDASPKSPHEREMIRKLEQRRDHGLSA